MTPGGTAAMVETDWLALGRQFGRALGVVARERLDLHGDAAYGEALRLVVAARLLVTMEEHRAEVARVASVADWNREQAESERRRRLADVAELWRTMDRRVADRMAGLADQLRAKAEREKLGHHVRRGVLLAADWLAAPAERLEVAEKGEAPMPVERRRGADDRGDVNEDVLKDSLDLLTERVRELEGALKGLIDEYLFQGDSRKPRPALARATAVLRMRDMRRVTRLRDSEEPGQDTVDHSGPASSQ